MEYKMANEFVIPNLMLEETPKPEIGKYGSMRKKFLAEKAPILYEMMQMEGTLYPHLAEINSTVNRQIEQTVQLLMQQTAAPDRKTNPLGWTQWMNALKCKSHPGRRSRPLPYAGRLCANRTEHIPRYCDRADRARNHRCNVRRNQKNHGGNSQ